MGMVMGLLSVSDETIRRLLADPPLVFKLLAPDDPDLYDEARADSSAPDGDDELELGESESHHLYLDKAWHGLHYLLTGTAWEGAPPLNFLLAGGQKVGDIEFGPGPVSVLSAAEVAQAARALSALTDESIRSRFDPPAMMRADIYPAIWDRPPAEDDTLGYLMDYLGQLRRFLSSTAAAGQGLVVSFS
jgi:hypothetical protein